MKLRPELFDVVELLIDLPEHNLSAGVRGAIVEEYSDRHYEIEFTNNIIPIPHASNYSTTATMYASPVGTRYFGTITKA